MGFFGKLFGQLWRRTALGKYEAAKNALVAKYTFSFLDDSEKQRVDSRISEMMVRGGWPSAEVEESKNCLRETQYFGMAAMAMLALDIKPGLTGLLYKNSWVLIRNPFVALTLAEKEIQMAAEEIFRKHGVSLEISDADKP